MAASLTFSLSYTTYGDTIDDSGFTHNAVVGDGDVDILVANTLGDFIEGPYLLLNDGTAQFTENTERLCGISTATNARTSYWAVMTTICIVECRY